MTNLKSKMIGKWVEHYININFSYSDDKWVFKLGCSFFLSIQSLSDVCDTSIKKELFHGKHDDL